MKTVEIKFAQQPATIGLQLSPTCIPNLNRATDMLRTRYPLASDAELLERIFVTGICATIDATPKSTPMLRITGCSDPQMWYANRIGELVPLCGTWPEGYKSRDNGGYTNVVRFADATIEDVV